MKQETRGPSFFKWVDLFMLVVVVFLNYWFAAVVSWNLLLIVGVELPLHL